MTLKNLYSKYEDVFASIIDCSIFIHLYFGEYYSNTVSHFRTAEGKRTVSINTNFYLQTSNPYWGGGKQKEANLEE